MSDELGILFLHHCVNETVERNLRSVREHNPGAKIITLSAGDALPNGYSLAATPELKQLHVANSTRSSDRLVCSWHLQKKERCKKWWIIEWDTYCTVSVAEYYRSVWEFPFVAASLRLPHREPEWNWFSCTRDLPREYRPYVMGAVPFLYLISEDALEQTCSMLLKNPLTCGNAELRFATAASRAGFPPCGFSPPHDMITWIPWRQIGHDRAVFHPVKHVVNSGDK